MVRKFLLDQRAAAFSYTALGATRDKPPGGYTIDRHRVRLGSGLQTFARAVEASRSWEMFRLGWLQLCYPDVPIRVGETVAIMAKHLGIWSMNACRIVYTIEESRRSGFAYGTLEDHAESGEERFTIEWTSEDDSVWYDVLAFSRPRRPLVWMAYPVARMLQRRFVRDSQQAMRRAIGDGG